MAIFHLTTKPVKRSEGRSAVAAAAYRAGERLRDERTGHLHNYSHRKEEAQIESWIMSPGGLPVGSRSELWNRAEAADKRKNSRPAREVEVALPVELNPEQQNELLRGFVEEEIVSHGVAADVCIHRGDSENPHCHILMTTRQVEAEGLGAKVREIDEKKTTQRWRESWASHTNERLREAGRDERIDHRSFKDQGIDREASIHDGPSVRAMEKRGVSTAVGELNRQVRRRNVEKERQLETARRDPLGARFEAAKRRQRERDNDHEIDRDR